MRAVQRIQDDRIESAKLDPEKGRDGQVVDWYGSDDEDNPMNWASPRKVFVTFQVCLLTFFVHIGSIIYSAGIEMVVKEFGVFQVAATLGLTLFVAGYGLGPTIWAPTSESPTDKSHPHNIPR